jgi:hypothetical protein
MTYLLQSAPVAPILHRHCEPPAGRRGNLVRRGLGRIEIASLRSQ